MGDHVFSPSGKEKYCLYKHVKIDNIISEGTQTIQPHQDLGEILSTVENLLAISISFVQ